MTLEIKPDRVLHLLLSEKESIRRTKDQPLSNHHFCDYNYLCVNILL